MVGPSDIVVALHIQVEARTLAVSHTYLELAHLEDKHTKDSCTTLDCCLEVALISILNLNNNLRILSL